MKSGLLIMVAVAVLLPSSAEGRIVSRCEVRDDLKKMLGKVDDKTLATVICEVERRSRLNTSLVTVFGKPIPATSKPPGITGPSPTRLNKLTPEAHTAKPTSTNSTSTKLTNDSAATSWPAKPDHKETEHGNSTEHKGKVSSGEKPSFYSLYGLFQLSDRQFCDSGLYSSKNECKISCTSFTNDDITDDTACVIKTGYWKVIEKEASASCRRAVNFFKGCK
ncbi:uncharacterized protein LOC115789031 [Archocentrus centrarchus]|uniref:uncharacterized protein LOC115789031 n=1 Tax=Archocentrus centrarchus TaxID=63155 RepID=UPI0011EA1E34|nr:uncharacterized protein LOC115789031 [Archocentrus centrarchus]